MSDVFGYLALSLDGYIAGPGDDLSFLPAPEVEGEDHGFAALLATVGCLLMGRRTFDVVMGFDGPWPYGDLPILVATRRPLPAGAPATVRAAEGEAGVDRVGPTAEPPEHRAGGGRVGRLVQHLAFEAYGGVRTEDRGGGEAGRDPSGLEGGIVPD